MNLNRKKLRNTLVFLLAFTLILLPNLVAAADSTEGAQGTPTPLPTTESPATSPVVTPENSPDTQPESSETPPTEEPVPSEEPPIPSEEPIADSLTVPQFFTHFTVYYHDVQGTVAGGQISVLYKGVTYGPINVSGNVSIPFHPDDAPSYNAPSWSTSATVTITAVEQSGVNEFDKWVQVSSGKYDNPRTYQVEYKVGGSTFEVHAHPKFKANSPPTPSATPSPTPSPTPRPGTYRLTFNDTTGLDHYEWSYNWGPTPYSGNSAGGSFIDVPYYAPNNWYVTVTVTAFAASGYDQNGWTLPDTSSNSPQTYYMNSNKTSEAKFETEAPATGSIYVRKKISGTFTYLAGAAFTLTPQGGGTALTLVETSAGHHKLSDIPVGTYTLSETVVPSGYTGAADQQVIITKNNETELFVYNTPVPVGSVKVYKKHMYTYALLAGATFTLTPSGGGSAVTLTETFPGVHEASGLTPGNYTLAETVAPSGFHGAPSQQVAIQGNTTKTLTFLNAPIQYGTLTVNKVDADGGTPLLGAAFTLVKNGTSTPIPASSVSVNVFKWNDLMEGDYTLTETSAPSGYDIQGSGVYAVHIGPPSSSVIGPAVPNTLPSPPNWDVTKTIENEKSLGSLKVYKKDSVTDSLIAGAAFTLVNDSDPNTPIPGNDDGNGTFTWGNLLPGSYTLTETTVPDGYYMTSVSQSVEISAGTEKQVTVLNDRYGSLTITKLDSFASPLSDVEFTLTGPDSFSSTQSTDGSGKVLWDNLMPGTYTLTESVPYGYYLQTNSPFDVEISQGQDAAQTVTNYKYGSITVLKKDSETGEFLSGAAFSLVNDSDPNTPILGSDDGNGTFTWNSLMPGSYTLTEESVPTGYYDAGFSQGIELAQGEDEEVTILNEKFVSITLLKQDDVTKLPLAGAVFSIEYYSTPVVLSPEVGNTNEIGVLGTVTTGSDGRATFAFPEFQLRAGATYLITEITPPYGYLNDSTPVYVTVPTPGGTNEEVALFENNPDYGTVTIAKFQSGSGNQVSLSGVQFSLYRDSLSPENLISTRFTDLNGNIVWADLFTGTFVLVEDATIAGYTLPADPITVFTLLPGESRVLSLQNDELPTPTPSTPVESPEATPTPTTTPSPAATPIPTATPTPVSTDEFIIDDVAPAFGPETGEGDFLFILMGILLLAGAALFVFRKKLVHSK